MHRFWKRFGVLFLSALLVVTQLQPAFAGFGIPGLPSIPNPIPSNIPVPIPNPGAEADKVIYQQIGEALGIKEPIILNAKKQVFPKVKAPRDFNPKLLEPSSIQDLNAPLDPGDYVVRLMSFCTQWSIHVPGYGTPYQLGRADGSRIKMITAFLIRGQADGLSPDTLHNFTWLLQSGLPMGKWAESDKQIAQKYLPDFQKELQGDVLEQLQGEYQNLAGKSPVRMPDFNGFLAKVPLGKEIIALKKGRDVLVNKTTASQDVGKYLYEATAEPDGKPQVLPAYDGNEKSPWVQIMPGVIGKYRLDHARAGAGSDGINWLEFRVLPTSQTNSLNKINDGEKIATAIAAVPTLSTIGYGGALVRTVAVGGATVLGGETIVTIVFGLAAVQALVSIIPLINAIPRILTRSKADDCKQFLARIFPIAHRKIPDEWWPGDPTTSKNFCGWRWRNPANELGNYVRIDEANPTASEPGERVDHVHVKSGQVIGWDGNPILKTPDNKKPEGLTEAHIPLSTWQNWSSWDRP